MKSLPLLLMNILLVGIIASCGGNSQQDALPEVTRLSMTDSAKNAAETFYGYLIKKQYNKFVESIFAPERLPKDYRDQLADAAAQYAIDENSSRNGITHAKAKSVKFNEDSLCAYVVLDVTFGDTTQEAIALPLIMTNSGWKMNQ